MKNINTDEWLKSIADEVRQNDVLNFEHFDNTNEEEDNDDDAGNEVVDLLNYEDVDEIQDDGANKGEEIFIKNENDEPIVYLDENELDVNADEGDVSGEVCNEVSDEVSIGRECDILEVMVEDYCSSDYSEESDIEYEHEDIPISLQEDDPNINFQWKTVMEEMRSYNNYSTFRHYVVRTMLPTAKVCLKLVMETNNAIDEIVIHFFPKDGPKDVYPVQTTRDGNCLANALAHLLLGKERMNVEIHVRATFIAVLRDSDFLNHDVLARNCPDGTEN